MNTLYYCVYVSAIKLIVVDCKQYFGYCCFVLLMTWIIRVLASYSRSEGCSLPSIGGSWKAEVQWVIFVVCISAASPAHVVRSLDHLAPYAVERDVHCVPLVRG